MTTLKFDTNVSGTKLTKAGTVRKNRAAFEAYVLASEEHCAALTDLTTNKSRVALEYAHATALNAREAASRYLGAM